jgi:hypothetical protein
MSVVRRKLPAAYNNPKFNFSYPTTIHKLIEATRFVEIQVSRNQTGKYIVRHNILVVSMVVWDRM